MSQFFCTCGMWAYLAPIQILLHRWVHHRYLEGQLGRDCVQGAGFLCPVTDSLNQNAYAHKNQVPWPEREGMLNQEG